jgi:hypothetical protein
VADTRFSFAFAAVSSSCSTAKRERWETFTKSGWRRTDGVPIYETVTIKHDGNAEQDIDFRSQHVETR